LLNQRYRISISDLAITLEAVAQMRFQ